LIFKHNVNTISERNPICSILPYIKVLLRYIILIISGLSIKKNRNVENIPIFDISPIWLKQCHFLNHLDDKAILLPSQHDPPPLIFATAAHVSFPDK